MATHAVIEPMPDTPLNTLSLLDLFEPLRTATANEGAELDRLKLCCEIVAEYKRDLTDSVVDWIDTHGEIEADGIRYYSAPLSSWTCTERRLLSGLSWLRVHLRT